MRMLTVPDSSNVQAIGYDVATGVLAVRFKAGVVYEYAGVTPLDFANIASARSVGGYIAQNVRDVFACTRVDPDPNRQGAKS